MKALNDVLTMSEHCLRTMFKPAVRNAIAILDSKIVA